MRAEPDGYTLLLGFTTELGVMPHMSKAAKYSMADFTPIAVTGDVPLVMIGAKRLQSTTLKDLLAEIGAAPGKFTYGGGLGSPSHISGAWMNRVAGLKMVHVPYKGGAQAVTDVIGGHIDIFYGGLAAAKGAIDAGAVKAFAQTGATRSTALPQRADLRRGRPARFRRRQLERAARAQGHAGRGGGAAQDRGRRRRSPRRRCATCSRRKASSRRARAIRRSSWRTRRRSSSAWCARPG